MAEPIISVSGLRGVVGETLTPQVAIGYVAALAAADGWVLDLTASGEKSLSSSLTIIGTTYFGTFSPDTGPADVCVPSEGEGRLYVIDLLNAAAAFDFDDSDINVDRSWVIGSSGFVDTGFDRHRLRVDLSTFTLSLDNRGRGRPCVCRFQRDLA